MTLTLSRLCSRRRTSSPIGLDIAPSGLRAAQLERTADEWRVLRVSSWNRRESEASALMVPGFAKRIIRSLDQAGYRGRRAFAGLSIPEVELHTLEIPSQGELQDERRFADAVRWELERVSGAPASETVTSYWRVPSSNASRTSAIGTLSQTKHIHDAQELVRAIGLDCQRVDATACALSRLGILCRRAHHYDVQQVWGVLDVGRRMLRLIVSAGDTPVLVRHLGTGSESWTKAMAESLGLSEEAAEVHKRDFGICPAAREASEDGSAEIAAMIYNIIRSDLDLLCEEIERSYEYVMRCFSDKPAGGMMLVGGGADLKGLDKHLTQQLGVEVQTFDDLARNPKDATFSTVSIRDSLNVFACAVGLAIDPEATA